MSSTLRASNHKVWCWMRPSLSTELGSQTWT